MDVDIGKIGDLRRKLGLTQNELARLSGTSQSLIAKIESGRIDPSYSKVRAIFNALEQQLHLDRSTLCARDIMTRQVISASPSDALLEAMRRMKGAAISQLPVLKGGKAVGSINDDQFMELISKYGNRMEKVRVADAMEERFPAIPESSSMEAIIELLRFYKAILVEKDGGIAGIITKADLIKSMRRRER